MSDYSLAVGREHLSHNRRMIIGRSLVSALAGLVPVPLVDDWLSSRVRRGTIRRIAEQRGVDITDEGVVAIADGPEEPPRWSAIAGATFFVRALGRTWKKLLITYVASQRARHAAKAYTVATLFDHYCTKLHVGLGLDAASAAEVRRLMGLAIAEQEGGLATPIFKRGLIAAARATVRAPAELLDIASGGRLRKLLARKSEVEAVAEVDLAIEKSMEEETGFLSRAARAVEIQIAADNNPYLDELLSRFEQRWREHRERHDDR